MAMVSEVCAAEPGLPWRRSQARWRLLGLACAAAAVAVLCAARGSYPVSSLDALAVLGGALGLPAEATDRQAAAVLLGARWPRVILGLVSGAALGASGAVMQGIFRNPLADPGLCGVSSGAALGAVVAIVAGKQLAAWMPEALLASSVPLLAFGGGLLAAWVVVRVASERGRTSAAALLLSGVAVSALCSAATGWLIFSATDAQLRTITFWSLGSLGDATWRSLAATAPFLAAPLLAAPLLARALDAMLLGEAEAQHLGFSVERARRLSLAAAALAVGASVALCGAVGFVGLVAPHLARLLVGSLHRHALPAAALIGAALVPLSDLAARTLVTPAELPLGVMTASFGAPFFLVLLARARGGGS